MKKLMMAVAVVCAAVGVKAAQVDWSVVGTSTDSGTKVYLMTSYAASYDTVAAFEAAAVDVGTIAKSGKAYNTGVVKSDDSAIVKSGNYYLAVIADATTVKILDVSSAMGAFVYDTSAQESSPGTFSTTKVADILASATTITIGGSPVPPGPEPIPEPTSAMLLLLGVAGLALRRRV